MFWIGVFIVFVLISAFLDSICGKITISSSVVAVGLLLLAWITGVNFLLVLARICAAIIVVTIVLAILIAIIK